MASTLAEKKITPRKAPADLATPTDLKRDDTAKVAKALNALVADAFALYLKTKNFHWHVSGPNFRDYHILLDEQAAQILASIDPLAERVRKLGEMTIRSISHVAQLQSITDNDGTDVEPLDMPRELIADNKSVAKAMRAAHTVCDDAGDVASASLLEVFIDETERRTWFLFESSRTAGGGGH